MGVITATTFDATFPASGRRAGISVSLTPRAAIFVVEDGEVRALLACPCCARTMWARWPYVLRFDCSVCATITRVELPPAPAA